MSKNLTRKGLALGAVVALGSSLFAGTPALAADPSINFASAAGTGTKTILGSTFELAGTFANYSAAPAVKVIVTGVTSSDVTASTATAATSSAADVTTARNSAAGSLAAGTAVTTPASVVFDYAATETLGKQHIVSLKLGSTITATTTVKVQMWSDSVDTNNKIDAGEVVSPEVSVTFVKRSEVVPTIKFDAPIINSTSLVSHTTLGDINLEQVDAGFVKSSLVKNGGAADDVVATYSSDSAAFDGTHTITAASGDMFVATAKLKNQDATFSATGASSGLVAAVATATVINNVGAVSAVSTGNVSGSNIRAGVKTFNVSSQVQITNDNSVAKNAPAGLPAKVVFTDVDLATGATLVAGGKTITGGASPLGSITVDATTDAAGKVIVPVTLSSALNGESFSVLVKLASKTGGTAGYVSSALATFNSVDAVDAKAWAGNAGYQSEVSVVKGGTVSVPFTVYDNFQQVYAAKKYRVTTTGGTYTTTGASISDIEVIENGTGSVSFTDNSAATGTYVLTFALAEYNSDAADWSGTVTATGLTTVKVNVVDSNTASRVTATTADNGGVLANADFAANNVWAGQTAYAGAFSAFDGIGAGSDAEGESLSGNVYDANGAPLAGVAVTIKGADLLFGDGNNYANSKVHAVGSITVYTNSSGAYSVTYWSHKVGRTAITVTSGSATASANTDDYANWAAVGYIHSATLTGDAAVANGRSAQYKVQLLDKFGNAVKVANLASVSYDGPGYFTSDLGAVTTTSATGSLAFTLITGSTDSGAGTLSVTLSGFGNAALSGNTGAAKDDNIVLTQAITVGAVKAPAVATSANASASKGKINVAVTAAAGKTVVVKVGGKFATSFSATGSKKSVGVKAAKGAKTVTIYVGGKLVKTVKVTVK